MINSNIPTGQSIELRKEGNVQLTRIHVILEEERTAQLNEDLKGIGNRQNDFTKMFKSLRMVKKEGQKNLDRL